MSRLVSTTGLVTLPPNFARHFIEGGWRELERVYGCRTALLMKWIEMAGGLDALQEARRQHIRGEMLKAREANERHLGIALAAVSRRAVKG